MWLGIILRGYVDEYPSMAKQPVWAFTLGYPGTKTWLFWSYSGRYPGTLEYNPTIVRYNTQGITRYIPKYGQTSRFGLL